MLEKKIKFNKDFYPILKKLAGDSFFILLVFFSLALLGEGLLPGIVTSHIGFSKLVIALGVNFLLFFALPAREDSLRNVLKKPDGALTRKEKFLFSGLVFFAIILIFNSLFKAGWFWSLALSLFLAFLFFLFVRVFQDPNS